MTKVLSRHPGTGEIIEVEVLTSSLGERTTLFQDVEALTALAIVEFTGKIVNSLNSINVNYRKQPWVDAISLEAGSTGASVLIAMTHGKIYRSSNPIVLGSDDRLYVNKFGKITTTPPSLLGGDRWSIVIGRLINEHEFLFDPQAPIDLTADPVNPQTPTTGITRYDEINYDLAYAAYAPIGSLETDPVWTVRKIVGSDVFLAIGSNAWTDRLGLTYV